jgi:hypothetical protein
MSNVFYVQSSTVGVDLNNMSATALFTLGTHAFGSGDSEWVYVMAQTTISSVSWVAFNAGYSAGMASATDVITAGYNFALANCTISASSYGWVAVRGVNMTALFTGTGSLAATSGQMQLASTAGPTGVMMLGMVGTASCTMLGVSLVATATASASGLGTGGANVCLVNLTYPRPVAP